MNEEDGLKEQSLLFMGSKYDEGVHLLVQYQIQWTWEIFTSTLIGACNPSNEPFFVFQGQIHFTSNYEEIIQLLYTR